MRNRARAARLTVLLMLAPLTACAGGENRHDAIKECYAELAHQTPNWREYMRHEKMATLTNQFFFECMRAKGFALVPACKAGEMDETCYRKSSFWERF